MRAPAIVALLVAAAALGGCKDPTEVMLIVKAGPALTFGAGADIDTIRVKVQPAADDPQIFTFTRSIDLCSLSEQGTASCRPQRFAPDDYDQALTLPVRLVFEPGSLGLDQQVRVWVDALSGARVQISNGIRFRFSRDRRLWIEMPLYRECIGVLTCQPLDLICGVDKNCKDAPTIDRQPEQVEPNDLSGGPQNPDAAQACGTLGLQCCGSSCDPPLLCNGNGYCIDPTATCGQEGQPCCASSMCLAGLTCDGIKCATACGDTGKACCTNNQCNKGADKCIGGTCQPCGGNFQQCCPAPTGPYCNGQTFCNTTVGRCEACGNTGEQCCPPPNECFFGTCQAGGLDGGNTGDLSFPEMGTSFDFSIGLPDGMMMSPIDGGGTMSAQGGWMTQGAAGPGGAGTCQ